LLNPDFNEDPKKCLPVIGGNVEISMRLTDTLLKAFGVVAASQGTMNNTLFGNKTLATMKLFVAVVAQAKALTVPAQYITI